VGTAVGAGIGAVSGAIAGGIAVSIDPLREAAADVGQWTANAAVNTYNWTDDRLQELEAFGDSVEREIGEGIESGARWVGEQWDRIPEVSMPDVDLPDVDLPDVDLPDVDLPGPF
jgi:hypothetical protein